MNHIEQLGVRGYAINRVPQTRKRDYPQRFGSLGRYGKKLLNNLRSHGMNIEEFPSRNPNYSYFVHTDENQRKNYIVYRKGGESKSYNSIRAFQYHDLIRTKSDEKMYETYLTRFNGDFGKTLDFIELYKKRMEKELQARYDKQVRLVDRDNRRVAKEERRIERDKRRRERRSRRGDRRHRHHYRSASSYSRDYGDDNDDDDDDDYESDDMDVADVLYLRGSPAPRNLSPQGRGGPMGRSTRKKNSPPGRGALPAKSALKRRTEEVAAAAAAASAGVVNPVSVVDVLTGPHVTKEQRVESIKMLNFISKYYICGWNTGLQSEISKTKMIKYILLDFVLKDSTLGPELKTIYPEIENQVKDIKTINNVNLVLLMLGFYDMEKTAIEESVKNQYAKMTDPKNSSRKGKDTNMDGFDLVIKSGFKVFIKPYIDAMKKLFKCSSVPPYDEKTDNIVTVDEIKSTTNEPLNIDLDKYDPEDVERAYLTFVFTGQILHLTVFEYDKLIDERKENYGNKPVRPAKKKDYSPSSDLYTKYKASVIRELYMDLIRHNFLDTKWEKLNKWHEAKDGFKKSLDKVFDPSKNNTTRRFW